MRRRVLALVLLLAIAACGQPAQLEVSHAWTRDTIGGTASAAVFMTITSPTADRLIGASTPAADRTDLMTMVGASSAMEMIYLNDIAIPANQTVNLNPTGLHVWLANLNEPLRAGQTFPLLLEFEKAGQREVMVSIIEPAAPAPVSGM